MGLISSRFMTEDQLARCCAGDLSPDVIGCTLHSADDRRIGLVDDILVDDESLTVRFLVVDTSTADLMLNYPRVMLAPALCCWDREARTARTQATAEQVRAAPFFDSVTALAQSYEDLYIFHYGERPFAPADH
jgi:hypothetical protein